LKNLLLQELLDVVRKEPRLSENLVVIYRKIPQVRQAPRLLLKKIFFLFFHRFYGILLLNVERLLQNYFKSLPKKMLYNYNIKVLITKSFGFHNLTEWALKMCH